MLRVRFLSIRVEALSFLRVRLDGRAPGNIIHLHSTFNTSYRREGRIDQRGSLRRRVWSPANSGSRRLLLLFIQLIVWILATARLEFLGCFLSRRIFLPIPISAGQRYNKFVYLLWRCPWSLMGHLIAMGRIRLLQRKLRSHRGPFFYLISIGGICSLLCTYRQFPVRILRQ